MMDRNYESASDEQLMAWSAAGERRAFDVLVGRHLGRAVRTAMRIVGNASDAEEIAQEAMLRIWTNARKWKPSRSKLSTWLYQIVVNLSIDRQRQPIQQPLEEEDDRVDPSPAPLQLLEERQRQRALARAIREMPERQRIALTLCMYEGLSGQEAAEALSTSLKALESLLLRGRRFLRERLRSQDVSSGASR
jgi:RNA polymerase sigma-70 factor (ECF subfamily)